MSIQAVAWALKQRLGSPTLKVVLIAVANYADEDGVCWPSQERLAQDTDLTERSVRDVLKKLEAMGFIQRTPRHVNGNQRETDIIRLVSHRKNFPVAPPPENDDTATGSSRHSPPERPSGKPSIEPSKNHHPSSLRSEGGARESSEPSNVVPLRRKTRLTEEFTLTSERLAYAVAHGLSEEEAHHEFEKFQHHFIGSGTTKIDWHRTLLKWFLTAAEQRARKVASGRGGPSPATVFHATQRYIAHVQNIRGRDCGDEVDLPF